MKGIILAGGEGTRLRPLTKVTSKQLLPVYNKPVVFYPLQTLLDAGITDILFIVSPDHPGDFMKVLGSGKEFGAKFTYEIQDKPGGLAQGLSLAETFVGGDSCMMILGDNIYTQNFAHFVENFVSGALIFAKKVPDPQRFGVVEFGDYNQVLSIEEKPKEPKSDFAQTGIYMYDNAVFDMIRRLTPSIRGELEITDLNNLYLQNNQLRVEIIEGKWFDVGTFESLFAASSYMKQQIQ
jgi:glucose-1-phosphate thymidylyltransferase